MNSAVVEAVESAGDGMPVEGEEPDARPNGPAPDLDGEGDEQDDLGGEGDDGGFSIYDWLTSTPEGSHVDHDARDWFDTETGGKNRIAFHLSELVGDGVGYPNGVGILVGVGEWYVAQVGDGTDEQGGDEPAGEGGESDPDAIPREEADKYT
jgi:hypothetical protein